MFRSIIGPLTIISIVSGCSSTNPYGPSTTGTGGTPSVSSARVDATPSIAFTPANVSVQRTFPVAGVYNYYCHIHPGMRGTIVVGGVADTTNGQSPPPSGYQR